MLSGNNGILTRAGEAKKETEEKSIYENIGLAYNSGKIEKYTGTKTLSETMEEELVEIYGADNVEVEDNGDETYTVTVNNQKYTIADGQIEKLEPVVNPYAPDAWEKAWIYPTEEGTWSDEIQKNNAIPENYEIIAKLYKADEHDEKYSLVIEGEGEMPPLVDYNNGAVYAWQTNFQMTENYQWKNLNNIGRIYICNGITSIGNVAFEGCTDLISINIPNSVTSIGMQAFAYCENLTDVKIQNGVTSIGMQAFAYCKNLTNVKIQNGLTSIGGAAFIDCTNLTNINIPSSVVSIGVNTFNGCTNLSSVKIPNSVTSIGFFAFEGCTNLTEITVEKDNGFYTSINGVLFNKDKTELIQYPACKKEKYYIIPDSVTEIKNSAFQGCMSLTDIKIPDSVTTINQCALDGCTNLKDIELSRNVSKIDLDMWMGPNYQTLKNFNQGTEDNYDIRVKWKDNYYYYLRKQ